MSVIFENYLCSSKFKSFPNVTIWHTKFPRLAVATSNGVVTIYNEEGEKVERGMLSRSSSCTSASWHPHLPLLITSWNDGNVSVLQLYDEEQKNVFELKDSPHEGKVSVTQWNHFGTRFVTADEKGVLSIWEYSQDGKITLVYSYDTKEGPITNVVLKQVGAAGAAGYGAEWVYILVNQSGGVSIADEVGHFQGVFNAKAKAKVFSYLEHKKRLAIITDESVMYVYEVSDELVFAKKLVGKINACQRGDTSNLQGIKLGAGLIATCSNEPSVRIWNVVTEENFAIRPKNPSGPIISISFNRTKRVLCGITAEGVVVCWEFVGSFQNLNGVDDWECYVEYPTKLKTLRVRNGPGEELLSYSTQDVTYVLRELTLKRKLRGRSIVVQQDSNIVRLEQIRGLGLGKVEGRVTRGRESFMEEKKTKAFKSIPIRSKVNIRKMDVIDTAVIFSNNKQIAVYEVKNGVVRQRQPIQAENTDVAVHPEGIFLCLPTHEIAVYSFTGVKKQTMSFNPDKEGSPTHIDIRGNYVVVATDKNYLVLLHMTGRNAKRIGMPFRVFDDKTPNFVVSSVKLNSAANRVSILCKEIRDGVHLSSTKLLIFNVNKNKTEDYDFKTKYPVSHFWDEIEPKLLAVETKKMFRASGGLRSPNTPRTPVSARSVVSSISPDTTGASRLEVCTLFTTQYHGIILQDCFPMDKKFDSLVGSCIPHLYYVLNPDKEEEEQQPRKKIRGGSDNNKIVQRESMKDFEGINITSAEIRTALMNFSYNLAIGNMEEAYKSVKMINDRNVWSNMAKMCVKNKKMDVAEICMSNMQDAVGSKSLRDVKNEPELEAQVAMLAIQLGMIKEAERLYKECKRFDLLNKFYQSLGEWDKSLQIAETRDRIHLQTTHYLYAKYLESIGSFKMAIEHYQKSGTHQYEIPRMYLEIGNISELQEYINEQKDPKLHRWWAQYCEGNRDFENAIQFYVRSKDYLALVRMNCFIGHFDQAAQIVQKSKSRPAAFHLAREYENNKKIKEAINYYKLAGKFKHGIRLAKKHDAHQLVFNLAVESDQVDALLSAAEYFEAKGAFDKAVLLYQKGGFTSKAIDYCFNENLYEQLLEITSNLPDDTDPEILRKCGNYFLKNQEYGKALFMFVKSEDYDRAISLFQNENIQLTKEMADQIKIPKSTIEEKEIERKKILWEIGQIAERQHLFKVASKKYLQAGDKIQAMKSLIRSGDTRMIIQFGSKIKMKQLYILAANYLQTLNWHNDFDKMKTIISFYKRARAYGSLSKFFKSCSRVEIDEYREYGKAKDALVESLKYLSKAKNPDSEEIAYLKMAVQYIDTFLQLRTQENLDLVAVKRLLEKMVMMSRRGDEPVRIGDIYAIYIEYYFEKENYQAAYDKIQEMTNKEVMVSSYVEPNIVNQIYQKLGKKEESRGGGGDDLGFDDEEVGGPVDEVDEVDDGINEEIDFDDIYN